MPSMKVLEIRIRDSPPFALSAICVVSFYALPMFLWEWAMDAENRLDQFEVRPWPVRVGWLGLQMAYVLLMILIFHADQAHEFIYFQF